MSDLQFIEIALGSGLGSFLKVADNTFLNIGGGDHSINQKFAPAEATHSDLALNYYIHIPGQEDGALYVGGLNILFEDEYRRANPTAWTQIYGIRFNLQPTADDLIWYQFLENCDPTSPIMSMVKESFSSMSQKLLDLARHIKSIRSDFAFPDFIDDSDYPFLTLKYVPIIHPTEMTGIIKNLFPAKINGRSTYSIQSEPITLPNGLVYILSKVYSVKDNRDIEI